MCHVGGSATATMHIRTLVCTRVRPNVKKIGFKYLLYIFNEYSIDEPFY